MPITINGNGTISGLSDGGLSLTGADMPSGTTLQIVSKQVNTHQEDNNTSFVDLTNMFLAITPNAVGNKILIQAQLNISKPNNFSFLGRCLRDSTVLPGGNGDQGNHLDDMWWNCRNTEYSPQPYTVVYLDTVPGTWSSGAITYKIQGQTSNTGTTWAMNQSTQDGNHEYDSPTCSNLTLTEIKA